MNIQEAIQMHKETGQPFRRSAWTNPMCYITTNKEDPDALVFYGDLKSHENVLFGIDDISENDWVMREDMQ